jgi:hypothetical protein
VLLCLFFKTVESGIGMEQIGRELTRELIETVRKEARQMRRTLKPLMERITSFADAAAYLPEARDCGMSEAAALLYGTEVFLAQYRRLLEKIGSVYREDAAAIMQMIREIERRVDEVVDKAYECTK